MENGIEKKPNQLAPEKRPENIEKNNVLTPNEEKSDIIDIKNIGYSETKNISLPPESAQTNVSKTTAETKEQLDDDPEKQIKGLFYSGSNWNDITNKMNQIIFKK